MLRIRNMAGAAKDAVARRLNKNKRPPPIEKKSKAKAMVDAFSVLFSTTVIEPIAKTKQSLVRLRQHLRRRHKKRSKKRKRLLAIRFNADGRGKFSVQSYDDGSVAIESDTAKRLLLEKLLSSQSRTHNAHVPAAR